MATLHPCDRLLSQTTTLSLSSATSNPGNNVVLGLSLSAAGTSPVGLEWTIAYPSNQVSAITAAAGPAATAASKNIHCSTASGLLTCLLTGQNTNAMSSGVVANVQLTLVSSAVTTALTINKPVGVDSLGDGMSVSAATGGVISVPTITSVTCSPGSVNANGSAGCILALNTAAPIGGSAVILASNNTSLTVPASVTVAAGATTATFNATAAAMIASNQSATVTATLGSSSQTATINLLAPGLVSGVVCSPSSLAQSAVSTCTVTLSQTAPAGGSTVTLASNNTSLTVPASVTVAAGATTATFNATAAATIASNQSVTLTATFGGSSQTAMISLLAPVLISTLSCSPTSLGPGAVSTCTLTLNENAPNGGSSVMLASNNASLAVPASVTVGAGAIIAIFRATAASAIASNQSATVTATLGGSSRTAAISLIATTGSGGGANSLTAAPSSLTLSAAAGGTATQLVVLTVQSSSQLDTGLTFSATVAISQAQNWLNLSPISGTLTLVPGTTYTYTATVAITVDATGIATGSQYQGIVNFSAGGETASTAVTMNVTTQPTPSLSVSPSSENLMVSQGTSPAHGQVTVSNTGGGTLQFSAQATSLPGSWLSLSGSGSSSATPSSPALLAFTADPTGLMPGVYTGQITLQAANPQAQAVVNVTLAVSQASPTLMLSQAGLTFSAIAGGQSPPVQSFTVSSQGSGSLNWTAQAQPLSNPLAPSANWLTIAPASGLSVPGQAGSSVEVSVNTAGLPAGQYYGSVNVDAPNAINNPQTVVVLLNVAAASDITTNIGFSTGGVILSGAAGGATAAEQQITLFNPSNTTINYSSAISTANGVGWLSISPASGQLLPGSTTVSIAASVSALSSGVQTGTVNFAFDNGTTGVLQVAVIATSGTPGTNVTGSAFSARALTTSSACAGGKPGYLVPIFRQPLPRSVLQAAVPQTVRLQIADDCGNPLAATNGGAVQVSFGNNDASINLQDAGGGIWEGTWTPVNATALSTTQAIASELTPGLRSTAAGPAIAVQPAAADAAAMISGVVNAAGSAQATPQIVTPGSYVAIYGTSLGSNGDPVANVIPLPGTLNDTQLFLGGQPMPLIYAGHGQVNALIPQHLNPNTSYQVVIRRGSTLSVPAPLTVAAYQPGIYTLDLSGRGQGIVEIAGTTLLAAPAGNGSRPVQSGSEYLVIFATGLGSVIGANGEVPPADGAAPPLTTIYQTTATVTAKIGGIDVPVVFSGLTPSLVALYQVNVQVPAGVPTGDAVPLVLTVTDPVSGQNYQSNSVTIAVQ